MYFRTRILENYFENFSAQSHK